MCHFQAAICLWYYESSSLNVVLFIIKEKNAAINHNSHLLWEKPKATHQEHVHKGSSACFIVEKHFCKWYNFAKRTAELTQNRVSKALKSSCIIYPAFHCSAPVADTRPSEMSLHHPKQSSYCPCCQALGRCFLFRDDCVFWYPNPRHSGRQQGQV